MINILEETLAEQNELDERVKISPHFASERNYAYDIGKKWLNKTATMSKNLGILNIRSKTH